MRQVSRIIRCIFKRTFAAWALTILCGAVAFTVPLIVSKGQNYIEILDHALPLNVFVFAVMALLSYELITQVIDAPDAEAIRAIPGSIIKIASACIMWLGSILTIICLLELSGFLLRALILKVPMSELLLHVSKAVLLYGWLPGFVGIAAGYAFSGDIRGRSYILIVLFAVLFSPPLTNILPEGPIGMMTRIDEWLRLFPFGSGYAVDPIYGIPLEDCRFALVIFWLFFFLTLRLMRKEIRSDRRGRFCLVLSVFIMFICGIRFSFRVADSILDPISSHGMMYEDNVFYDDWKEADREECFTVKSYDLQLLFNNCMKAEAKILLPEEEGGEEKYAFTLYHGLKVSSVKDTSGGAISFSRNGDWLDIYPTRNTNEFIVTYSGYVARHYSNKQCIFLPGYIAYYPMPGHIDLWDRAAKCFQPVMLQERSIFTIHVNSSIPVISNLQQIDKKTFSGVTSTPLLIGGYISTRRDDGITVYYPTFQYEMQEYQKSQLETAYTKITKLLQISSSVVKDIDRVFVLSPLTRLNNAKEESVFCDGYFTHSYQYRGIDYDALVVNSIIAPLRGRESIQYNQLKRLFSLAIIEEHTRENPQEKPTIDKLKPLILYDQGDGKLDGKRIVLAQMEFNTLFYYQLNRIGRKNFCPKVYTYLEQYDGSLQPVEFLYRMEE